MGGSSRRSRSRSTSRSRSRRDEDRHRRPDKQRKRSRSRSRSRDDRYKKKKKSSRSTPPRSRSRQNSDSESDSRQRSRSSRDKKKKKKSKKSRRRSSSSSSDSDGGASSDSSMELLEKLEHERRELKNKRRREKERMKAMETPEEKRARRLAKKEAKARRDKMEKMGWDEEYVKYTNDDNPFGDSNLTDTFRWNKKLQREGLDKVNDHDLQKIQRAKFEEQKRELEKVKQRRIEREREREEMQQLREMEDRQRENDKFSKWQQDEDDFHLQQARLRSSIRIMDGRAKPIDLLAKYIAAEEEMDAVEMHEPYTYLNGLTTSDLEDLLVDIKVYERIDLDKNRDFWQDIVTIVNDELHKLKKMDVKSKYEQAAERRQGINQAVASDVQDVFKGKSSEQLAQLQLQIEAKLSQRTEGVDVGYWESLLSQLKAHLARARLRDKHSDNLKRKLELLKAEQGVDEEEGEEADERRSQSSEARSEVKSEQVSADEGQEEEEGEASEMIDPALDEYNAGGYSPVYITQSDLPPGSIVMTETEELSKREIDQKRALKGSKVDNVMNAEEKALEREAKKGMNPDEEASFSVETQVEQTYEWSDKYRPRKPRYFNRVHTGFEWNKYNQTHYDVDNPPPKIVQGYKFNIFYPDLIDKRTTPQYSMTPCQDNKDFCILRIHAGPPYEDIAFKIVNREWEFGYKRGFRCQFQNNIFQLWFHFKRLRYRR